MLAGDDEASELVVSRVEVNVQGSLAHGVSASFSKSEAEPGEGVDVSLSAAASARVYILAVDKSVRLLAGGSSALTANG